MRSVAIVYMGANILNEMEPSYTRIRRYLRLTKYTLLTQFLNEIYFLIHHIQRISAELQHMGTSRTKPNSWRMSKKETVMTAHLIPAPFLLSIHLTARIEQNNRGKIYFMYEFEQLNSLLRTYIVCMVGFYFHEFNLKIVAALLLYPEAIRLRLSLVALHLMPE